MPQEVLVLAVKRYRFLNKDTGETIEGTKIDYLEGLDYPFEDSNMKGCFPMNVTGNYAMFEQFGVVPSYYNMEFRQRPDSKGKPITVPVAAKYSRPVNYDQKNIKAV